VKPIDQVKPEPQPEEPEQPEEAPEETADNGVEGGVVGGVEGGVVGGVVGGKIGGELGGTGTEILPFGEGMTRPERLSGNEVQYTREAREARVEGLVIVKCVVTIEGDLKNCRLVKPLPFMEANILEALKSWKYKPATFQGKKINVDYVINFRLQLR
jgi:protein TonB